MAVAPDRTTFESMYSAKPPPWDIGKPQKALVEIAEWITGTILDAGCGTGENALYFAGRGHQVTGIDYLEEPLRRAKDKAAERGLSANFQVMDALNLKTCADRFDNVIDCGLFHVFNDSDRKRYVEGLATVLKPGGRLNLLCFGDEEPGTEGPRRVSKRELYEAFADGWTIQSIESIRFETRSDFLDIKFSDGGPKGWLMAAQRNLA